MKGNNLIDEDLKTLLYFMQWESYAQNMTSNWVTNPLQTETIYWTVLLSKYMESLCQNGSVSHDLS